MKSRLFKLAAGLSLLLAIAIVALWVRSYFRCDVVFLQERQEGPPIDPQTRQALVIYQLNGWGKTPDRFFQNTRHELFLSRGHFAIGAYDDQCMPGRSQISLTSVSVPRFGVRSQPCRDLPTLLSRESRAVTGSLNCGWSRTLQPSYPMWIVAAPTFVLPLWWTASNWQARRRRRRREASNLCPACGYDLRAHNAGDRCPECGVVPASDAV